jgi:Superinfection immunity protein
MWLYFIPSLIASHRTHRNKTAIFILNLFTGWTFAGWIASLVWAFTK